MEYLQSPDDVFYYGGRGTFPTAFCDGSVHHLFFTVAPETWLALLTRNGQERIRDSDWDSEYSETSRLPSRY